MGHKLFAGLVLLLVASPLHADPIFATVQNRCVPFQPNTEIFWWSAAPFDFASFWSEQAGCAITLENPRQMFERIENFDGHGGLAFRVSSDMVPDCGRAQWDAGDLRAPISWLIVDMGADCAPMIVDVPLAPLVSFLPPDVLTGEPLPPNGITPPLTPLVPLTPEVPIPEPATFVLLGGGMLMLARRLRG